MPFIPKKPVVLYYSTGTHLAYTINELYYQKHFLWCSPVFDPLSLETTNPFRNIPVSSAPHGRYKRLLDDIAQEREDMHSSMIAENRQGIIKGALIRLEEKLIDKDEFERISSQVNAAKTAAFRPILYLIPASPSIVSRMKLVDIKDSANPLSFEYQIADLCEGEFDAIELKFN